MSARRAPIGNGVEKEARTRGFGPSSMSCATRRRCGMFLVSLRRVRGRLLIFPKPVTVGVQPSLLWRLDPAVECFVRELDDGRTSVEVLWHNNPQLSGVFPDQLTAAKWARDVRQAFLRHGYCLPDVALT